MRSRLAGLLVLIAGAIGAATTAPAPPAPPYERSDVSVRGVVAAGVGLLALLVVAVVVTTWVVIVWSGTWPDLVPPATGVARGVDPAVVGPRSPDRAEAPEAVPRLQPAPRTDISVLRAHEDAALSAWAWVDREAGIAQVPIEVAIEVVAERGLPEWGGGTSGGHEHGAGGHAPGGHAQGGGAGAPATGAPR